MEATIKQMQGRVPARPRDAEGASLVMAMPDESLRQKDPVLIHSGKSLSDTDGASS
jgi:hypothetical protein